MNKYRVRLDGGRVVGPLFKEQIGELYLKNHITGQENCQLFPNGDWKKIDTFRELNEIFLDILSKKTTPADLADNETRLISRIKLVKEQNQKEALPETLEPSPEPSVSPSQTPFAFPGPPPDLDVSPTPIPLSDLPDSPVEIPPAGNSSGEVNKFREFSYKSPETGILDTWDGPKATPGDTQSVALDRELAEDGEASPPPPKKDKSLSTTRVLNKGKPSRGGEAESQDKTMVRSLSTEEMEEVQKLKEKRVREREEKEKLKNPPAKVEKAADELVPKTDTVSFSENTQMVELENLEVPSKTEIIRLEEELLKPKSKDTKPLVPKTTDPLDPLALEAEAPKSGNAKKMTPVVFVAFLAVIYFLLFEEEKEVKTINPVSPKIVFPMSRDKADLNLSNKALSAGLKDFKNYTYISKIKAAKWFRDAYELNTGNKLALGNLILVYAELLPNVISVQIDTQGKVASAGDPLVREKAGNVIFKLIQIADSKIYTDINMAMGTALFYSHFGKYQTALNTLTKYRYVGGKPTVKFWAVYLETLLSLKKMEDAKKTYELLTGGGEGKGKIVQNYNSYLALANYAFAQKDFDTAEKYLEECNKKFPNSVKVLLDYGRVLVHKEDLKKLEKVLKVVKELQAEQSGVYYAKYLEFNGLLLAAQGKTAQAGNLFQKSLQISESIELRSKLASLNVGGGKEVSLLIEESKVLDIMNQAREAMRKEDWDKALRLAIDATDMAETSVPAKLLLAEVQTRKGYFGEAIKTLGDLASQYPLVPQIQFALIQTNIQAFKFSEARKLIENLSGSPLAESAEYASSLAKLYIKSDKILQAMEWLQKSLNRDPLNDKDYFAMAKIFLRFRKYEKSKIMLDKAITLDPINIQYKLLYSKILYELESPEVAIGYLEKMLEDNMQVKEIEDRDIPRVMGEMAIYYQKNGQLQQFENIKKDLEKNYSGEKNFYEFLVEIAKLDDKVDDVIKYSKELSLLDPGNLEAKTILGEYLLEQGKINEALAIFTEVQGRLESYPRIQFFLSKIYFLQGNMEKALELVNKEIKSNPEVEHGYLLLGEIYLKQEKYPDALAAYKKAQAINQNSVEALMGLASIQYSMNNLETALDLYTKAATVAPSNAPVRRQLGYVYKAMGQGSLALEAFKIYLELAPDAKDREAVTTLINQLK